MSLNSLVATILERRALGLDVNLLGPGQVPSIGPERGKVPKANGIGKYTSPHGSTRYVAYVSGHPVSALQVVSRDGKHASIANVFTDPQYRRSGWASTLMSRARKDFKTVSHASEVNISGDGRAWRNKVG